jgi:hypothetical protein
MDSKFHMDSFERLLKERSDEFRMYPASKVWYSIYNNIYPGRRWPSAVVSIILIATLPLIGYLNTSTSIKASEKNRVNANVAYKIASQLPAKKINTSSKENISVTVFNLKASSIKSSSGFENTLYNRTFSTYQQLHDAHNISMLPVNLSLNKKTTVTTSNNNNLNAITTKENTEADQNTSFGRNELLEKYTIRNTQLPKKWSDKLALQVYASPSVVYGIVSNQKNNSSSDGQDANSMANQNSSIGLEAGTAMQYALSDVIKVKAGLQFNYASYDVEAITPNILNEAANSAADMLARSTDYANNNGFATLHNETYQFSLPVGLELKLLKSHNIQWNAGATIQPTFIAGGNAYLLSSDSHNFIDESSIINRWNLNAGFETFITYKTNGLTWQFGPQFRYQFSSTYGKNYGVDEKLAVFGVKIGVSKVLR